MNQYPEPKDIAQMSSNRSYTPSSQRTQSTKATSVSSKAKRSSAYDKDFEQNLIDHNIYPKGYEYPDDDSIPEPSNLDDIVQVLSAPRASLSPSQFSRAAFKNFALANDRVISEGKVMSDIFPIIRGNANIPNEGNLPFTNLDSITDSVTVDAVPDLYDGTHPNDVDKDVRQALSKVIVPTNHGRAPLAPNFFVEAKAPRGGADVAKRQACLDGAIGARAMHSLQTYGENNPVYDGNAHSFSSTYHAGTGTLQLYAHHITAPSTTDEQPEYHMTQIDTWGMTGNINTFRRGATAFRNVRDLARQQRETFIKAANERALQIKQTTTAGNAEHTHRDDRQCVPPHSEVSAWQDSHDDLQQHIAETCAEEYEGTSEIPTTPRMDNTSDESQDFAQDADSETDAVSTSFVSNLTSTSSFSTDYTRPKRSRQSFSSPTQGGRSSKSRSRFATSGHPLMPPTIITKPTTTDSVVSPLVGIVGRERSPTGQKVKTELKNVGH